VSELGLFGYACFTQRSAGYRSTLGRAYHKGWPYFNKNLLRKIEAENPRQSRGLTGVVVDAAMELSRCCGARRILCAALRWGCLPGAIGHVLRRLRRILWNRRIGRVHRALIGAAEWR
jgi:hypothetical protein